MENFIVSARKYRPQTFDTVVGQHTITNTLKNAIRNNQLAQAFLFCGPRGVGKTTCARILAKTINCEHLSANIEACDKCSSCVSFNENASFNIYELDGASNNSVDDIRTLVEQVRIPPQMGRYKVYIIDEVHMLSASAFNAFLKTLEEPPSYAKFILATTEKHKIIPTILSRCQIFDFKRITIDDIADHLAYVADKEHVEAEHNALHIIAQKADGAMRDALSIFDQLVSFTGNRISYETVLENLNVLDFEYFFKITDQILQGDITGTLLTINEIIDMGFDGQHFIIGFGEHIRNLLVSKDPATVRLLETAPGIRNQYLGQSGRCPVATLIRILELNNQCDLSYKASNNKRLHLEIALMQMASIATRQPGWIEQTTSGAAILQSVPTPTPPGVQHRQPAVNPAFNTPPAGNTTQTGQVKADIKQPVPLSDSTLHKKPPEAVKMRDIQQTFDSVTSIRKPVPKEENPDMSGDSSNGIAGIDKPFSQADLLLCWDEFAETLKKDSPHLYSTLRNSKPVLSDNWVIDFTFDNKILENELSSRKTDMMEFMRKGLQNSKIQLRTTIAENSKNVKPYTDKEKFDLMAEKNPALKTLREELDLDIEY